MFDNVFVESTLTQAYYSEYLSIVNKYKNVKRPSVFCRYFNINMNASVYNGEMEGSFDRYDSGILYDSYDLTPLYYSSQLINDSAYTEDLKGEQFQGNINVTCYTINKPRHEDILMYIYPPQDGGEIFRVSNVRSAINAMTSSPGVNWFELTLEYAPIIDHEKLKILNHYVYSLAQQKYLFKDNFVLMLRQTEKINSLFKDLKLSFNRDIELYGHVYDSTTIYSLEENYKLYQFLSSNPDYVKYFSNAFLPFGIKQKGSIGCITISRSRIINSIGCPYIEPTSKSILDYDDEINIYDMNRLLEQWLWYQDNQPTPIISTDDSTTNGYVSLGIHHNELLGSNIGDDHPQYKHVDGRRDTKEYVRIFNNSGSAIPEYVAVKVNGSSNENINIAVINSYNDNIIGITQGNIPNNTYSTLIKRGLLKITNFDTTLISINTKVYVTEDGIITLFNTGYHIGFTTDQNIHGTIYIDLNVDSVSSLHFNLIEQNNHGFVNGNILRVVSSNTYCLANADDPEHAEVVGIVSQVINANRFKYISLSGTRITLTSSEWDYITGESGGLVPNQEYFLSETPGKLSTTPGTVFKSLLIGITSTTGVYFNMQGFVG